MLFTQIGQHTPALTHQFKQPAAGAFVVLVGVQVLLELANSLVHERDLHLRRTGIAVVHRKIANQFGFLCHSQGHLNPP